MVVPMVLLWLLLVAVVGGAFVYLQASRYRRVVGMNAAPTRRAITGDRNRWVAVLLAVFLGGLGLHKFYLGDRVDGVLSLCLCWTGVPAVLAIIDVAFLLMMNERSFDQVYNTSPP